MMAPTNMAIRGSLVLLLLSLAYVAESFDFGSSDFEALQAKTMSIDNGRVGDTIDLDEEMMLDSESARRGLQKKGTHIGYSALKAGNTPCKKRGQSYYNCGSRGNANPYKRGCSAITRCARDT